MSIGLHAKYRCYSCSILMKLEFFRHIFEKYTNIKFHENSSSGSRIVPFGWTDGRTDMSNLIVAFGNFAKATKNFGLFGSRRSHHAATPSHPRGL